MRSLLLALLLTPPTCVLAQNDDALILLARTYKDNMFRNEPTKETLNALNKGVPNELGPTRDLVVQMITTRNDLGTARWMTIPDETALRNLHTVRQLDLNMRKEDRPTDAHVLDSLRGAPASRHELVRNYYDMVFTAIGNKNKPFNLSKLDLRPDAYGLKDDTERGILFLECMGLCRSMIWGYMNVVKPPNTREAMSYIKRFPKVNGVDYYRFNDLVFPDFEFVHDDSLQSYKGIMIDHYLELLMYHTVVLDKEGAKEGAVLDLILGSSMRDERLWKYSKNKETFEELFKKQ
jgi:hypothetical protein